MDIMDELKRLYSTANQMIYIRTRSGKFRNGMFSEVIYAETPVEESLEHFCKAEIILSDGEKSVVDAFHKFYRYLKQQSDTEVKPLNPQLYLRAKRAYSDFEDMMRDERARDAYGNVRLDNQSGVMLAEDNLDSRTSKDIVDAHLKRRSERIAAQARASETIEGEMVYRMGPDGSGVHGHQKYDKKDDKKEYRSPYISNDTARNEVDTRDDDEKESKPNEKKDDKMEDQSPHIENDRVRNEVDTKDDDDVESKPDDMPAVREDNNRLFGKYFMDRLRARFI